MAKKTTFGKEEEKLRRGIIETCLRMNEEGLNQGTSGNIGVRRGENMLITPSGMPYREMTPEDIICMSLKSGKVLSEGVPSTEWRFHRDILLNRPEVEVVLHNHSKYATSVAIARLDLPACHYMVAVSGGNSIRCAEYATFGTEELSVNLLKAMEGRNCCLLANHGLIATGQTLDKAYALAVEIENLACQFIHARMLGSMHILDDAEMETVVEKFKTYGKPQAKWQKAQ